MTFEKAIEAMKQGKKVYRKAWENTEMDSIYLSKSNLFTMICDDVFADDWEIYEEPQKEPEMTAEKAIAFLQTVCGSVKIAKKNNVAHILYDGFDEAIDCINFAIEALENQNLLETEDNLNSDNETANVNRAVKKYNDVIGNLYSLLDFYKDNDFYRPKIMRAIAELESEESEPEKKCECKCNSGDENLQEEMKETLSRKFFELDRIEKDSLAVSNMLDIYRILFEVKP